MTSCTSNNPLCVSLYKNIRPCYELIYSINKFKTLYCLLSLCELYRNKQTNKMAMQKLFFVFLLILSSNNISCYSSSFVSLKETSYTNFPKYLGRSLKASQTTFNVISYGAKGDGTTDDTKVHII